MQFSEKRMPSSSNVSLVIEAAPNSFCAVRAVDQSVLLLKTETELSAEMVSYPNKCTVSFSEALFSSPLTCLSTGDCVKHLPLFACAGHEPSIICNTQPLFLGSQKSCKGPGI